MSNNLKILISSRSFGKIGSGAIELIKNEQLEPVLNPFGRKMSEAELLSMSEDVVGIIAGTEQISNSILSNASNLKVISRYGIGLDNIDLKYAKENGIMVYNTPETPSIAVAELTITLILNLLKKINIEDNKLKHNKWAPELGGLLSEKTVGIFGLGRIGKKISEFFKPFNVNILCHEIKPDENFISKNNIELVSKNKLLSNSDIVTLHLPLNEKTRYFIGIKELKMMKETALLINTARGGLVNEIELYEALKNKVIAGAALDVFENEPETGKLKNLDNVILTPHIATFTDETRKNMELESVHNLLKGLKEVNLI